MKPDTLPYKRLRFKRFDMATRDCRLTLIRRREGACERQNGLLVDLSYAGLRFQVPCPIRNGAILELVVSIASPVDRSVFLRARACQVSARDSGQFDCGAELLEESKGLLGPDEEWPPLAG